MEDPLFPRRGNRERRSKVCKREVAEWDCRLSNVLQKVSQPVMLTLSVMLFNDTGTTLLSPMAAMRQTPSACPQVINFLSIPLPTATGRRHLRAAGKCEQGVNIFCLTFVMLALPLFFSACWIQGLYPIFTAKDRLPTVTQDNQSYPSPIPPAHNQFEKLLHHVDLEEC